MNLLKKPIHVNEHLLYKSVDGAMKLEPSRIGGRRVLSRCFDVTGPKRTLRACAAFVAWAAPANTCYTEVCSAAKLAR